MVLCSRLAAVSTEILLQHHHRGEINKVKGAGQVWHKLTACQARQFQKEVALYRFIFQKVTLQYFRVQVCKLLPAFYSASSEYKKRQQVPRSAGLAAGVNFNFFLKTDPEIH